MVSVSGKTGVQRSSIAVEVICDKHVAIRSVVHHVPVMWLTSRIIEDCCASVRV
jgi:hypothetical protein